MFLKRVFVIIFLSLFFSQTSYLTLLADPCINFKEAVNAKSVNPYPEASLNHVGIYFDYDWDKSNKKIIKRDKNNFPIVSISIWKELSEGTVLKSHNGTNLSSLDDDSLYERIDTISDSSVIEYFDENKKINKIKVSEKTYNIIEFFFDNFFINTIGSIEAKEGFFELDYAFSFFYIRPDLQKEGKLLKGDNCGFKEEELKKLYFPHENIVLKQFDADKDKVSSNMSFEWSEEYEEVFLIKDIRGIAKIREVFDFSKFPFDKQVLNIPIESLLRNKMEKEIPTIYRINPSEEVHKHLLTFKEKNYLQEWKVTDIDLYNFWHTDKTGLSDTLIMEILIERNANYYIFKIILPVLLILIVAWSVLWIPAREEWVESRLTTSIVALLSLIAYNFVFQDDIPKLDILTSLDKFVLLSYIFCAIPIFTTIFLSRFIDRGAGSQKRATRRNRVIRYVGGAAYIFGTLTIFFL